MKHLTIENNIGLFEKELNIKVDHAFLLIDLHNERKSDKKEKSASMMINIEQAKELKEFLNQLPELKK